MSGREIICWILRLAELILLARVVMSFVPRPPEPIMPLVRFLRAVTEPVLAPLRRVIPPVPIGGVSLDLSILIVFFALVIVQRAVCG